MPRSIRLLFHNRWNRKVCVGDSGGPVISASGEQTDHEADKTQNPAIVETWRSPGLPGAYISGDLGAAYRVGAVAIVGCNLSNNGTYRVRVSSSSTFATSLYDSGSRERDRFYSDAEIARALSSEFFPDGLPNDFTGRRIQRQVLLVILPAEVTGQYVRVDFDDPTNPDGYMEVSYIYAGISLEPDRDLLYGWKIQRDNIVRGGQAACGQYWSASVLHKTLMEFTLAPQRESDLTGYWMLLESLVSINEEGIVSLVDFTDSKKYTTTIYGKFAQSSINTNIAFQSWQLNMRVEELID
jgi:hypothetical protein